MSVELSGEYRFNVAFLDQELSDGFGRGHSFKVDEAEIRIDASNTADNGIKYGVTIQLKANTDSINNADEIYTFLSGDFGRLEMGDQDDATDRMHLDADKILVGRAGPDGDVPDLFNFGSGGAIDSSGNDETSDATKVTYFSPRFAGLQVGVSFTPDDGAAGASFGETDNDGNYEKVWGFAANYVENFGGVAVGLSAAYEIGDSENSRGAKTEGDLETISFGGKLEYAGLALAVGYVDFAEKGQSHSNIALGEDSGHYWDVGIAYREGSWGISASYFASEKNQPLGRGGSTTVDLYSIDGEYEVAPSWLAIVSVNFIDADNVDATATPVDDEGSVIIFANTFNF